MTAQEEIKAYLDQPKAERDFQEGVDLFCKYSKELAVQNYIRRKRDVTKLHYKLEQLLLRANITLSKSAVNRHVANMTEAKIEVKAPNTYDATKENVLKSIKREDLPETLQPLFDDLSEKYKFMRSLHEKMKLAKSNAARAQFRSNIVELDDAIRNGWGILDQWADTGEVPAEDEAQEAKPLEVDAKSVNAARKYLSTNLPKLETMEYGPKRSELIEKIKERYTLLLKAGNKFDEATLSILEKYVVPTSGEVSE